MSEQNKSTQSNVSAVDPLQRLSSFKSPRDLSLGGVKTTKKVFAPNLNVSRNKNKSALPTITRDKRDYDKGRRDRKNDRNKNIRNGPNIIKGTGVFSEGMGTTERHSTRISYGRDVDTSPTLPKRTLRVKDAWKVDKELEDQKIKNVFEDGSYSDEEQTDHIRFDKDAPIRLPLSDGVATPDVKPPLVKSEPQEDTDLVTLLQSDKPTLIMLQFPDSLPGRARREAPPPKKQTNADPATSSTAPTTEDKVIDDNKCRLSDLEEGKIGKLVIHKSGRVRLALGDTMFEVAAGTQGSFRQEAVSVAVDEQSNTANIVSLGALPHKLNLLPHWESLLADIKI